MSQTIQIVEPTEPASQHGISYLVRAFENPAHIISESMLALENVQFDTMIGTGLSGALVVPTLARALGRHWAIVRKPNDDSHTRDPCGVAGRVGSKWVFVDDQICSGMTLNRVKNVMAHLPPERGPLEFVGALIYHPLVSYQKCRFIPAWEITNHCRTYFS